MSSPEFNHQSFLLWKKLIKKIDPLAEKNKITNNKGSIPIHLLKGSYRPSDVVSRLLKQKKVDVYKNLLNLETYKISSLVPEVKLYKIFNG